MGLGLFMTLRAYSVYVASVLLFVAQLEKVPSSFLAVEEAACRKLFPGPHKWMTPAVLKELGAASFPLSLLDVHSVATAAQSRVCRCENLAHGGLQVERRAAHMRERLRVCDNLQRLHWVCGWAHRQYLFVLEEANTTVADKVALHNRLGTAPSAVFAWRTHVAASQEDEDGEQQSSKRRRWHPSWQSAALQVLRPPSLQALTVHFRRRLDPSPLSVLPGYRVQRVLGILARLRPLVAPRVIAAYLRTVCDGWMTLKRFQQRGPCRFCGREIDSLRHIAR